jgi:hypothetical protein
LLGHHVALKGHGFSRAANRPIRIAALQAAEKTQYEVKMPSKSAVENLHPRVADCSWGILVRSILGGFRKIEFFRSLFSRWGTAPGCRPYFV